jgi:hypothetical protein
MLTGVMITGAMLTPTIVTGAVRARISRTTMVSRPMVRRRNGGAHPLSVHAVHDAIELFDDPIEAAGRIVACRSPLGNRPVLRSPREMNPARHGSQHHHTSGHGQPFQTAIHDGFSLSSAILPWFTGRFRGGTAGNSMLLES